MVDFFSHHSYGDDPPSTVVEILGGSLPARWGRMDALCRAVAVHAGVLFNERREEIAGRECGLICGTRYGCLNIDLDFKESMSRGMMTASPLLFSYTLPNIGLSECAVIFNLKGPVYAVYDVEEPLEAARSAARLWLLSAEYEGIIVTGTFDYNGMVPEVRLELCM